ncbi:FeoA family protein [Desulfosporosinus metallidurans]|uniref:Ferrous iron transporter FeoA-like domain-containing protein n=1 Tax=Desulfosporosinus metallidurans TaxID=1888891 RepID=A0A1Q8QL67_9FIRM|nr:FeoA family protein [Desulfosporosinus metallidurans]OLN28008.1 hypothetical protein DSOL_4265 [Desulfosporosinus metallidurans]
MPLTMLTSGREAKIIDCKAEGSTKKFLEALGIIPGVTISVISRIKGNLIVLVKGTRLALNKGIANQLFVQV